MCDHDWVSAINSDKGEGLRCRDCDAWATLKEELCFIMWNNSGRVAIDDVMATRKRFDEASTQILRLIYSKLIKISANGYSSVQIDKEKLAELFGKNI